MTNNLRATLSCAAAFLVAARSPAQDDGGPLEVLSSDELAPPVLVCSPGRLSLTASEDVMKTFRITVKNAGGRVLHWSVASTPAWALPEARSGKLGFRGKEDLVLTVISTRLKAGTTRGVIMIEAPGAKGSPAQIPIRITYTAKSKERPRDRRRPEPPAVRRPVSTGTRHWRWSYGVPLVGGMAGITDEGTWNPGPIAFFERHWGARGQHSVTTSFWRVADGVIDERVWDTWHFAGDHTEAARVTYRNYFGAQRTAAFFLELGVAVGELEVSGQDLYAWWEDDYEETQVEPLLGLGLRFRRRGGRSAWFTDLSLGFFPDRIDYELFGHDHAMDRLTTLSLMLGWSIR